MGKIICLMGKSSTGKDTLFKRLLEEPKLGLKKIVPYTTRPIRDGERDGVEYFFTDEAGFQRFQKQNKIIEARKYDTFYGLWRYFVADDGQIEDDRDYLMIGTLEAYRNLQEYFGAGRIVPLLIELDDGLRLQRALDRERQQESPRYEEMCRRFLADSEDFSEEKIREAGISRRFVNDELEGCLKEIRGYLAEKCEKNF
ncbi:MAG: 50S ribosome-binding GTPase [bacterium]|nr:50S ribosome-binding GTPase [bacterium]